MALQQLHHTKTSWIPCFISQEQRNSKLMCQCWKCLKMGHFGHRAEKRQDAVNVGMNISPRTALKA
ncbi:hypothetical protein MJO28_006089 [Puccinia striiformis f. sp. tritici]|uniref:Uncharacterized protein n=1 Tax=Puccinia striiformis f. sp. tritici TaxID=168172 RepID=A0ACC0EI55_9BASI|nr:hypothetical protein MJO28_006089 [Puccinia striiformis f. sp. tritici]